MQISHKNILWVFTKWFLCVPHGYHKLHGSVSKINNITTTKSNLVKRCVLKAPAILGEVTSVITLDESVQDIFWTFLHNSVLLNFVHYRNQNECTYSKRSWTHLHFNCKKIKNFSFIIKSIHCSPFPFTALVCSRIYD